MLETFGEIFLMAKYIKIGLPVLVLVVLVIRYGPSLVASLIPEPPVNDISSDYTEDVIEKVEILLESFGSVDQLIRRANSTPQFYADDSWLYALNFYLETGQLAAWYIIDYPDPETELHDTLVSTAEDCYRYFDQVDLYIISRDSTVKDIIPESVVKCATQLNALVETFSIGQIN